MHWGKPRTAAIKFLNLSVSIFLATGILLLCFSEIINAELRARDCNFNTFIETNTTHISELTNPSGPALLEKRSQAIDESVDSEKNLKMLYTSIKSAIYIKPETSIETATADVAPALEGIPLAYPNPFSMNKIVNKNVSYCGTKIGYYLTRDMEMRLIIYDMFAHKIYDEIYMAPDQGARTGWNEIDFNRQTIGGLDLPAGVYFFLLIYEGKVLGKGKMAIVP